MSSQELTTAVNEHVNRIIHSSMATNREFLDQIIERLQSHRERMNVLADNENVDFDSLPSFQPLAQGTVSLKFSENRMYIVQSPVPAGVKIDDPKITTLRATPQELLEYIAKGGAKTDDFELHVTESDGTLKVPCVEITVIDQNDTAFVHPLKLSKKLFEEFLRELCDTKP